MEIPQTLAPLQAEDLQALKIELERILNEHQQQIFLLRQFLEAAIKHNENAPNQAFNP